MHQGEWGVETACAVEYALSCFFYAHQQQNRSSLGPSAVLSGWAECPSLHVVCMLFCNNIFTLKLTVVAC